MKIKNEPLVSIIMSTYSTPKEYLKESIESILNQTYTNFEFIIICDGECDDINIINSYDDKRIKVIKHDKNRGLPYSLNEGINVAKGKYIARMDSDDISFENRIYNQVKYMEKNKSIDICSMFCKEIGNSNKKRVLPYTNDEYIKTYLVFQNLIVHPLVMFRRDFLLKNKIKYDEHFVNSQDYALWCTCKDYGKFAIIKKVGLKYRIHGGQISTQKKQQQYNYYVEILKSNLTKVGIEDTDNTVNLIYKLFKNGKVNFSDLEKESNFCDYIIKNTINCNKKYLKIILCRQLFNKALKNNLIIPNFIKILQNKSLYSKLFYYTNFWSDIKILLFNDIIIKK